MLTTTRTFTSPSVLNTALRSTTRAPTATRHLLDLGSTGVRSIHTGTSPGKSLKTSATPVRSPDATLLSKLRACVQDLVLSGRQAYGASGLKYTPVKIETKQFWDADKTGPRSTTVTDRSYGALSKETAWKDEDGEVKLKGEVKALQVATSKGYTASLEVYVGKSTLQGEVGVNSPRGTTQARMNVTGGMALGYVFISMKDQAGYLAAGVAGVLQGRDVELPSLKNVRMELFKPILSVQLERRDLQNGTLIMGKLNLANVLKEIDRLGQEGGVPRLDKMLSGESKTFDEKLAKAYRDLGDAFEREFRSLQENGVAARIDETVEDRLGDWRSDGEGWSQSSLERLKQDILVSTVMANVLGLDKDHTSALPVFKLGERLYNERISITQ